MPWLTQDARWLAVYITVAWVIRVGMVPVMLRRQLTPGACIAWLGIIFLHPYIGLGLYLLVGESRLGLGRLALHRKLVEEYRGAAVQAAAAPEPLAPCVVPACTPIILQASKIGKMPILCGNEVDFIGDSTQMIDRLAADIASAATEVHLLYYILADDESGRRIVKALIEARARGVSCRLLVDEFASRRIFRRHGLAAPLRDAGVEVVAALPTSPWRRRDLRQHRKLAIIDKKIAWCGSQNLIDADYAGRRGGPWVDLSGRLTGPVVGELSVVFAEDWAFETGRKLDAAWPRNRPAPVGEIPMQVVPTGPAGPAESYRRLFLGAVQVASKQITVTTPYFVPDDPTLVALMMAADRGVEVTLIVPKKSDNFFAGMAGRSHFDTLLSAGVKIHLYRPALIHAKTITIDNALAIFGSANLDVRSFNLNFELSVVVYGSDVTQRLRSIQLQYLSDSEPLDPAVWAKRPVPGKYADRAVALLSPLL
jgi:cardiolipin synthase